LGRGYARLLPGSDAAELLADEREQVEAPTGRPFVGGLDRVAALCLCATDGKENQADLDRDCDRSEAADNQS
jgi:hypothetical protein